MLKLLAIPTLLAGATHAFGFWNQIPIDAYYPEGSDFLIQWTPDANRTDTFRLELYTFSNDTGNINETTTVLNPAAKYSDGNFTWHIELIEDRSGPEWWYRFGAQLSTIGEVASYARAFHIEAL
ncbi:hypothetical protein F4777DRAFT_581304 [Nemania sp. FL0916]|nr:hypothetical protein F4777DRAFT_581304 [Nemania sp. FL0916]